MRTVRMKVYKFQELSEQAKQRVLDDLCDINVDHGWWQLFYDDAERIGINITGFDLNNCKVCRGEFITNSLNCAVKIKENHGVDTDTYKLAHSFTINYARIESEPSINNDEIEIKIEELSDSFLASLMDYYCKLLSDEYDYLGSTGAIIATIEANEYEFTSDGKRYVK